MQFDLLIKGGHVVDPGAGRVGRYDVAIKRNRIAVVDTAIPAEAAVRVIDATGQYVTPGLVDLHTHVYHNVTYWGIQADPVAARTGVTTWLDVGSAGAFNNQKRLRAEGLTPDAMVQRTIWDTASVTICLRGYTQRRYRSVQSCD